MDSSKTTQVSKSTQTEDTSSGKVIKTMLNYASQHGDEYNSKMAQKTLQNAKKVGMDEAMKQMAKDCFKHPTEKRQMSYAEMRSMYG